MNAGFRTVRWTSASRGVLELRGRQGLYDAAKAGGLAVRLETSGVTIDVLLPAGRGRDAGPAIRGTWCSRARIDSVTAGPGINDDGSGTAWQLALAEQLAKRKFALRNKVRFLWFGGEEDGLVGSHYYAGKFSDARSTGRRDDRHRHDRLARTTPASSTTATAASRRHAGPDGSATIEDVFVRYFARRGWPRADPVRRPLGLRRLRQPRHPLRRHLPRRRGSRRPWSRWRYSAASQGEQLDPSTTRPATTSHHHGPAAGDTMIVDEADPTLENLATAQEQADQLQGTRSSPARDVGCLRTPSGTSARTAAPSATFDGRPFSARSSASAVVPAPRPPASQA